MKNSIKKYNAFTLSEAILVMAILGLIAAFTIPTLLKSNTSEKSWEALSQKMVGNLIQSTTQMLINDARMDDFTQLHNGSDYFSIEDIGVAPKMAKLFKKYISKVELPLDTTQAYFQANIIDYQRSTTGAKMTNYSDYFITADGIVLGFRFYGNCTTTETNAMFPTQKTKKSINNICGSVFMDVNGLKKPNKLGSDQYIIPVGKRGMVFENE